MKRKFNFLVLFLILSILPASAAGTTAAEIIGKVNHNFLKIKDASADIRLEYALFFFGCSGQRPWQGKGYYKSPDKIKAAFNQATYFARGNKIRKIDEKGKGFYIRLLNSLDLGIGFHAGLITHNFRLSVIKNSPKEIIIEGIPKPGILKNAKKVIFYIDPQDYLLRKFDVAFENRYPSGTIKINYKKIDGLWVPVGFHGKTAVEIKNNLLVGMGVSLTGKNIKINGGLPDKLFDPGF